MDINFEAIENNILQSRNHFQDITIRSKKFNKDTKVRGDILVKEIYHLALHYEKDDHKHRKSFYLEVPYNNPYYEELKQLNIYCKERKLYADLFPQYELLLPTDSLHPEFYGTDGNDVLILEDLFFSAYQRAENQQLNLEQFTVALRQLAKFHALSIKVHDSQPQILNEIRNIDVPSNFDLFSSSLDQKSSFQKVFREIVSRTDATFAGKHPEVMLYFEYYLQQMSEDLLKLDDGFNVLNHGNVCTKNIWFTHDDLGAVTGAKFTKFQHCHWGNPVTDIIFFTITSLPFEIFEKKFNNLLGIYTTTLNATLEKLNCDQRLNLDVLRGYVDTNYEYFLYFLVAIAPGYQKTLQTASDKVAPKEYIDEVAYNQLSKLWTSHFIEKGIFSQHEDLAIAIHTFIRTFEAENKTSIFNYDLDRRVLKPGSNFTSLIVRLNFKYRKDEKNTHGSVLVKIPSLSPNYDDNKQMNVYEHEIFVYQSLLPELYKLWKGEPFAPICYAISETKIMVLEDLTVRGFRLCDKKQQLDLDHCRIALENLARYHAVSFKYLQQCDPAIRDRLKSPIEMSSMFRTQYRTMFARFLRVLKPLVEDSVYQKMERMEDKLPQDFSFGRNIDESGINVIGHCDYWTNNILFQYEDGHVRSLKMVDWQLTRLASPAVDLIFFSVSSVRFEVFETYKDALLNLYLDTLHDTLSKLECNLEYSRTDLDEAMRRYRYYFWSYIATEMPFMMTDEGSVDNIANTDDLSELALSATLKWVNYLVKEELI